MDQPIRLLYLADQPASFIPDVLFAPDPVALPVPKGFRVFEAYLFGTGDLSSEVLAENTKQFFALSRQGIAWNPLERLRLARLLRRISPDVLLVRGPWARVLGLEAARSMGVASRIVLACDLAPWMTSSLLNPILRSNAHATRFIVDSFAAAQRLIRQERVARDKIEVVGYGVECGRFGRRTEDSVAEAKHRLGLSSHQPVILSAGTSEDFESLLDAICQMLPHQPDVRLLVWGQLPPTDLTLRDAIAKKGLTEQVIITPSETSFEACVGGADVGVVTSFLESCSPFLLQYQAAELPCVATNTGGHPELIRHGESGYLVNLKDADQLAMFMTILVLSPELAGRFSGAARKNIVENYSMERALRAREDFFRMLAYAQPTVR